MSKNENGEKGENGIRFARITRIFLLLGIIGVSIAMAYSILNPEKDPDVVFIVLNEEKEMKDYPTHISIGEGIILYAYVQNMWGVDLDFSVHVYRGANITVDEQVGVAQNVNATLQQTIEIFIENNNEWISDPINSSFSQKGENYEIIFELWQKKDGNWQYMPQYILIFHFQVD